jgi:hypothetical protein
VSKTKNFAWVMNRVLKCHFAAVNVFELKKCYKRGQEDRTGFPQSTYHRQKRRLVRVAENDLLVSGLSHLDREHTLKVRASSGQDAL